MARRSHGVAYDRDAQFGDWIDQGNGCDTRAVVLQQESRVPTTQNSGCTVLTGQWLSPYDATVYTDACDLQIDHVVPVKNVWVSGAWAWSQTRRTDYYNDLTDARTLVAVDSHDNEAKGDSSPDEWLPPARICRYLGDYVSVKLRWGLTVSTREKRGIALAANSCRDRRISFTPTDAAMAAGWSASPPPRP